MDKKSKGPVAYDDRRWMAQDDARTLARAEEIKGDSKRFKAAAKEAKSMAKEKMDEANAMKKIAKRG